MIPDLWGLPGKTHAYSDIRLWNGASSRREIPLLTINALCYRFINMSIPPPPPPASLPFCLSAYFSIHQVHFVSSQLDRLKARERPEESVVQEALIVNQGSSLWSRRGMTLSCDGKWEAGCSVYYQANYLAYGSTQVQHGDVTLLFSGDSTLNLISVFITETED